MSASYLVDDLKSEAISLHMSIFNNPPSDLFVCYYVRANQDVLMPSAIQSEIDDVSRLINEGVNLLNVEAAIRLRGNKSHLLCRKVSLASYLAECDGEHFQAFESIDGRLFFWFVIPFWAIKACIGLFFGRRIFRKYGI